MRAIGSTVAVILIALWALGCDGTRLYPDWFGGRRRKHHCPPAPPPAPPPTMNTAPSAAFSVNRTSGALSSAFQFDASASSDSQDATSALEVRWDWEDDGNFDTAFSTTKTASHTYTREGTKRIRVEVRDSGGLTSQATRIITLGNSASDVNGDGYADLVIGAPDNEGTGPGKVYVFFGGPSLTSEDLSAGGQADVVLTGEVSGDDFGSSVATGDVNGDGIGDVIVGAPSNSQGAVRAGRAYVFLGGGSLASEDLSAGGTADYTFTGELAEDVLGFWVAAGDVNNDGVDDVLVGAPYNINPNATGGRVYVFFGGSGLTNVNLATGGTADVVITGDGDIDRMGTCATSGDVNGDGRVDLVVAAQQNDAGGTDAGRVYVFFGPVTSSVNLNSGGVADVTFTGAAAFDQFGFSVRVADVNGDGVGDIITAGYLNDAGDPNAGRAYVFFGSPTHADVNLNTGGIADVTITGAASGDAFGNYIAVSDVNGDGVADFIASAPVSDAGGADSGRVYVLPGGAALTDTDLGAGAVGLWTFTGAAAGDRFSIVGGGDVDGDGTPDVVVGAIWNDAGGTNTGRVYVFKGPNLADVDLSAGGSPDLTFTGRVARRASARR